MAANRSIVGFTLIEVLVVLVIMAIVLNYSLFSFGDFGASRKAKMASEHFRNFVKLFQQEAILTNAALGIVVKKNSYHLYYLNNDQHWVPSKNNLASQNLVPHIQLLLLTTVRKEIPQIVINVDGSLTAFQLAFGTSKIPKAVIVETKDLET